MKKLFTIFLLSTALSAAGQSLSIGPKLNVGTAFLNSQNLAENFEARALADPEIISWDAKSSLGLTYGLGAVIDYSLSDQLSVFTELTYNFQSTKFKMDREENTVDGGGNGNIVVTDSEAKINIGYFSIPLMARYRFSDKGYYIYSGLGFDFFGTPEISSEETETDEEYAAFALQQRDIETLTATADLDNFSATRLSLIIGGGVEVDINDRKLLIDIRYNLPLTKSSMYTTNLAFDDIAFDNNEVFTVWGKTDAELDAPQHLLNDFKTGRITLSLSMFLFSKDI